MTAVAASPRRILFVETNDDETVGGSHRSMFDVVRYLDRSRYTPVVCFYRDNPFVERYRALGVEVHVEESRRQRELDVRASGRKRHLWVDMLRGVLWRRRMLRELRIDLLHLNNSPLEGTDDWLPAARVTRVPIVCMARGHGEIQSKHVRYLARYLDRIVAVSAHMAEAMLSFDVPAARVVTVYNGIDLARLRGAVSRERPEVREELRVLPDQVLVLMVGNIRDWKGQHVALEAVATLPAAVRDRMRLAFVGTAGKSDLAYRASLDALVASAHLEGVVSFLGARDDVADLLSASDIALHCSTVPEPFGRVVPEAMCLGIPVVASALGGPLEIVTADSGRLFDPRSPRALAAILETLIADAALRIRLGTGARVRADAFGVDAMVAGISRVYADVLTERGKAPA